MNFQSGERTKSITAGLSPVTPVTPVKKTLAEIFKAVDAALAGAVAMLWPWPVTIDAGLSWCCGHALAVAGDQVLAGCYAHALH